MSKTVDTNVLVRGLVDDGTDQSRIADAFLGTDIYVASTVILETEWVLRTCFGADRQSIHALFTGLLGMENVEVENRSAVSSAVAAHAKGLDFADSLHLYSAAETEAFVTFDIDLRRHAKRLLDVVPIIIPN